jgi:hypothetical protein
MHLHFMFVPTSWKLSSKMLPHYTMRILLSNENQNISPSFFL